MKEKDKRPIYEPPVARDLSKESVSGQIVPMGICAGGPSPFNDCVTGLTFHGACSAGGTPSGCSAGTMPETPSCREGSNALAGCLVGGDA